MDECATPQKQMEYYLSTDKCTCGAAACKFCLVKHTKQQTLREAAEAIQELIEEESHRIFVIDTGGEATQRALVAILGKGKRAILAMMEKE